MSYRVQRWYDHRAVRMAAVVQRMVAAEAAGLLFTADPLTSNRRVAAVEAGRGPGEALASGRVSADVYGLRNGGAVVTRQLADARGPVLADARVAQLVQLGRRIEAHFGCPQDIE